MAFGLFLSENIETGVAKRGGTVLQRMQMLAGASKVLQKWGEPEFLISTKVMANQ